MLPTLSDGDEVLVDEQVEPSALYIGDIVWLKHPFDTSLTLIKRLTAIEAGRLVVHGDNPSESTDSRSLGALSPALLRGRAIAKPRSKPQALLPGTEGGWVHTIAQTMHPRFASPPGARQRQ